jgi:hypothetical protein
MGQYNLSKHATGTIYSEEAGNNTCDGCHTGDGFRSMVVAGGDVSTVGTSPINCKTCHTIHTNYDSTDFTLSYSAPVKLRIGGNTLDCQKGNLCVKCHQGRAFTYPTAIVSGTDTSYKFTGATSFNRFGPHYGTISNVFSMNGPIAIPGSVAYPTSNPHAGISNSCVTCHMGTNATNDAVGGHTFKFNTSPSASSCSAAQNGCHVISPLPTTFRASITTLVAQLRAKIVANNWLDTTQTVNADGSYNIFGEYMANGHTLTLKQTQAFLNYLYIAKDRSNGAHNPAYVQAILQNSIEALN